MGIHWEYVKLMDRRGMLSPGTRILDIGSSNLYCADADEVAEFLVKYAPGMPAGEIRALATRLADGSGYDPVKGGLNRSFAGELFDAAGMDYLSFDIAQGYKTVVLDFNNRPLPANYRAAFDLVLNFGTTEHVFHQFNSFKIIHEATTPGGWVWHQLPAVGFTDHCYFTYTGRFFFELASYNGYELSGFWFGAGGQTNLFDSVRSYASYYPVLAELLENPAASPQPVADVAIPNVCINAILRKADDRPFMGSIERSTSVGDIPTDVLEAYHAGTAAASHPAVPDHRPGLWAAVRARVRPILSTIRSRLAWSPRPAPAVEPPVTVLTARVTRAEDVCPTPHSRTKPSTSTRPLSAVGPRCEDSSGCRPGAG
jgi:hypothetical protein